MARLYTGRHQPLLRISFCETLPTRLAAVAIRSHSPECFGEWRFGLTQLPAEPKVVRSVDTVAHEEQSSLPLVQYYSVECPVVKPLFALFLLRERMAKTPGSRAGRPSQRVVFREVTRVRLYIYNLRPAQTGEQRGLPPEFRLSRTAMDCQIAGCRR